jgi:Flp pilus assembly protein TadG
MIRLGRFGSLLHLFRRHTDGAVAVEFSLIAPVMLLIIFGSIELTDAVAAKRRLYLSVGTVGDLLTTFSDDSVEEAELNAIFEIGQQVLEPYGIDNATIRATAVTWSPAASAPVVVWSRFRKGAGETETPSDNESEKGYRPGDVFEQLVDNPILDGNEQMVGNYHVVVIETNYTFKSDISDYHLAEMPMYVKEVRVPRYVSTVHLCAPDGTCTSDGA